jgi:hypothetical protein
MTAMLTALFFLNRFDQILPSDPIAKADVPKTAIATLYGLFVSWLSA